jgi:hypothetical protein
MLLAASQCARLQNPQHGLDLHVRAAPGCPILNRLIADIEPRGVDRRTEAFRGAQAGAFASHCNRDIMDARTAWDLRPRLALGGEPALVNITSPNQGSA